MVDAVFEAYFMDGADIGDAAVLAAIAGRLGLEAPLARRFLATVAEVEAVHADNLRAHRLGINGVPCFVVAGRHAIAGAQEPEVLERLWTWRWWRGSEKAPRLSPANFPPAAT